MANRSSRTLYGVLIVLFMLVVAGLSIFFAVRAERRHAWRTERKNSFKQVGLALHNFHDTYKRFPLDIHRDESGKPLSSWRFHVLPFLEAIMRDWDYSVRWDDPVNQWLTSEPNQAYCFQTNRGKPRRLYTNVVAITGPGTVFNGDRECTLEHIDSDTVLAIEVADFKTHWAAPGDLSINEVTPAILNGLDGDGLHILFADGTVWYVKNSVDFEDLKPFFTIEVAKKFDRTQILGPHTLGRGR